MLNRPFLAWQLALLREHGVTDVVLACSYRVDDVRRALGEAEHLGVRLRYVIEGEPLGTGGGVRNAADLAVGTVFVLNGDVLSDVDLSAMRAFHEARRSRTTIFLTRVSDPRQYGLVETAAGPSQTAFPSFAGAAFPVYHLLADLAEIRDGKVDLCRCSHPVVVEGLSVSSRGRRVMLLANLTHEPQTVHLADEAGGSAAERTVRYLDETTAEAAMRSPDAFRAQPGQPLAGSELRLKPYAVARITT